MDVSRERAVSLLQCPTYEEAAVQDTVRRAVDLLGGIQAYVKPGQRVLLKPNLLRAAEPGEAICTHPTLVKAVVNLVQEAGGHPVIGDSPGGPFRAAWLRSIYQKSGMVRVAEETGAALNWDFGETHLAHPDGHLVKGLEVGTYVTNADVIIALPKLKTHGFMQFTGATKILFGVIPGTIKLGYHAKFPELDQFADMLLDILALIRPALTIMDGIVAMDGDGPSAGDPFELGAVLASTDMVALDVVAATLVGLEVEAIAPLRAAIARGLTTGRVSEIDIRGDDLDDFDAQGFRASHARAASRPIFDFMSQVVKRWVVASPRASDACIGCGICARNCPVAAITVQDGRASMDLNLCIRCYCCHEMCPERAIELRKPWFARLLV